MSSQKSFRSVLAVLSLLIGMGAPSAHSQQGRMFARATIPFAFQYSDHVFAAGSYTLTMISDDVMIVGGRHAAGVGLVRRDDERVNSNAGKLIFKRQGDRLVLQSVWVPGLSATLICPKAKQSRTAELAQGAVAQPETTVEVALL